MSLTELRQRWRSAWPQATRLWSPFAQLSEPEWSLDRESDGKMGLTESFAFIRLLDQRICISLVQIQELGLQDYALEILAHEVGHHIFVPGDLLDNGRAVARARFNLPTLEHYAPTVLNIYEDLLINDRLFRFHDLSQVPVFKKLRKTEPSSNLWCLYMRAYEILWSLSRDTLIEPVSRRVEGDAQLVAKMVRSYASDWLEGVGPFSLTLLEYLREQQATSEVSLFLDALRAGEGQVVPLGLAQRDGEGEEEAQGPPTEDSGQESQGLGQFRQPFEYGELLRSLGINLNDQEIAARYYRERALPHLIPFPTIEQPRSQEPLLEGVEPWEVGHPLEAVDWLETVLRSPRVFPGMTTVQRVIGTMAGQEPQREPVDLDLYVDCSGSIPNPQKHLSFLTLAGTIVSLSALRAGARVQATLWSGKHQFMSTPGFVRDEDSILKILTGYYGGGTAFPLHVLRETYRQPIATRRPVHILILSDDGVDTMGQTDEEGTPGLEVTRSAFEGAGGGGTMALLLGGWRPRGFLEQVENMGWDIFPMSSWDELVAFARAFARKTYSPLVSRA